MLEQRTPFLCDMPRSLFVLVLFVLALPTLVAAQMRPALQHVQWRASLTQSDEAEARLSLSATIAEGWKLYALDTPPPSPALRLSANAPEGVSVGAFVQDEPIVEDDPNLGVPVRLFKNQARFQAPVRVSASPPADSTLQVRIVFTICDANICLPPTPHTVEVSAAALRSVALSAAGPPPNEAPPTNTQSVPDFTAQAPVDSIVPLPNTADGEASGLPVAAAANEAGGGGMGAFLILAFIAGLAALLTPCVFPMIPLTVSYFTRHSENRGQAMRMAMLYGASIVGTFTGLGLLLALLVGAAGAQRVAADPYVNLLIGVIFVIFGLSLLGLFELRVPSALLNRVGRGEQRGGALGVLFMGLTLTLVSFSCTVPFVGGLLAATVGGAWFYPALGMLVFSATFALPFVLFALFPRALQSMPRSGAWMNAVKVTLGFVELAAALKFLSQADILLGWNVLSRPLVIAVTVVLFALCGLYLLGKLPLKDDQQPVSLGVGRLMASVLFFGSALYLLPGLIGASVGLFDAYLPPRRATDFTLQAASAPAVAEEAWYEGTGGLAEARQEALATGKPLFIDFTGYTCTNCRYMEANVFRHPDVQARFDRDFVLVRLYTDDPAEGEVLSRYQLEQTGTVALPTYTLLDVEQDRVIAQHSGTASVAAFVTFLDRGRVAPQATASTFVGDGEKEGGAAAFPEHG